MRTAQLSFVLLMGAFAVPSAATRAESLVHTGPLGGAASSASEAAVEPTSTVQDAKAVTEAYHGFFEARDREGLADLWRANPGRVLVTIDADLEASLRLWEQSPEEPDRAGIAELHARALFGAEVAAEARGNSILRDYASAFVGWTDVQKLDFRAGQAAFGRAAQALRGGDAEVALAAAQECRERALPLGDWWGTAMGLEFEAAALRTLGRHEEALAAGVRARQIYHQLGLGSSALGCALGALESAISLERWQRAHALCDDCVHAVAAAGDRARQAALLGQRAAIEDELGLTERAAATRAEADALGDQ
ncbi:hypothetical protein [Engelhardtia mirabilis]|uniref:Tetratricopeptide repeat protein n=1 Tax=Engelhardtia mirabilis TaxID=2528011 RepID=A0A518BLG4_9BACT|nr:hypothetical protein Pla133_28940 [Planctomycetes bacterium Pla133]QDV02131.1 hypothetical protein Pla86_28930 [Planctomycetes bacterium Pla86]